MNSFLEVILPEKTKALLIPIVLLKDISLAL